MNRRGLLAGGRGRGYTDAVIRPRFSWFVLALAPLAVLHSASCGEADTAPSDAGTGPILEPVDSGKKADTGSSVDSAVPNVRLPPILPSCVGVSIPMRTSGEKSYVAVPMSPPDAGAPAGDAGDAGADALSPRGSSVGDFLIDFGANGSTIDLKGFKGSTPPTPAQCFGDPAIPGATCYFDHFDFFGTWGRVGLVTADYGVLFSSVRQSGIIGTDFLANYPFTLDYEKGKIHKADPKAFCTDAQLLGAGFSPIPTGGFYANDTKKLRPLSEVLAAPDAASTAGFTVPNVPTVPIAIGGVRALAQIDSGYDDRVTRHSMNVNQALLEQIQTKDPGLLVRAPEDDLFLTTCAAGVSQKAAAYRLRKGTAVDFIAEGGVVGRHDEGNVVFVKDKIPEAEKCGGIDTWTVPAAQLGASFLVDAFSVIFDPFSSRVWIPK